jgi:LETM1 and EF-hand domain-containing protein 1
MRAASSINAQYMAVASISTLRSRSVLGLAPSIPFAPLQTRLQLFRTITTETRQSTTSTPPPPPPSAGASKTSTTVATKPPLSPAPPLPISSIPPKIVDVAAEKVQEKALKRDEKPKKGLPARAWAKVKEEASHYWHGTKLLGQEIKISAKLQYKVLQGSTLTRRERRQVSL